MRKINEKVFWKNMNIAVIVTKSGIIKTIIYVKVNNVQ